VGSNIEMHVHYAGNDGGVTGSVRWGFEYEWQSINGAFVGPGTIYAVHEPGNTTKKHVIAPFPTITGTNQGMSSFIVGRLFRDGANGSDTYQEKVYLLGLDLHYQVDSLGSSQEYIK
jgi:hypothetical protein